MVVRSQMCNSERDNNLKPHEHAMLDHSPCPSPRKEPLGKLFSAFLGGAFFFLLLSSTAYAGEGVTLIFQSGQMVTIEDGFGAIVRAMESLDGKESQKKIVKLNLNGSTFLVDVSEVVVVCRDTCRDLKVAHQLDPSRGKDR